MIFAPPRHGTMSPMSIPVYVDAYSGYKANERTLRFWLDATLEGDELEGVYEIAEVENPLVRPERRVFQS